MSYSQLDYYYRNRKKILEKNRIKAKELAKYNDIYGVKRRTKKPIDNNKIQLKVRKGKFIVRFD